MLNRTEYIRLYKRIFLRQDPPQQVNRQKTYNLTGRVGILLEIGRIAYVSTGRGL